MTFPTTPILDRFDTNGGPPPPGGNWANLAPFGGVLVVGNEAQAAAAVDSFTYWTPTFAKDQEVYCQITARPGVPEGAGPKLFLGIGYNPVTFSGYIAALSSNGGAADTVILMRIDAGATTVLGVPVVQNFAEGDWFGVQKFGSILVTYRSTDGVNWTQISAEGDNTYNTAANIGLAMVTGSQNIWAVDNFGGGGHNPTTETASGMPTHHQSLGLSVLAFKPTIGSYTVRGELFDGDIASKMDSLSIEKHADGGWWAASITLNARLVDAELWFSEGLNLNIEIYNPGLVRIFRGFVNVVELSAGALSAQRGPVLDVVNRLSMTYAPILSATANPPIYGSETTTTIAEDTDSQAKYGIIEKVFAAEPGRCLQTQAEQQRDTFLNELKEAQTSEDAGFSAQNVTQVVLRVLGYRHRLNTYIHQNTTAATVQIDTKIEQALASDPNALFSTDYTGIGTNAFLVNQFEDDNRTGEDVIRNLVEIGGATSDNRYLFGIYDDEKAQYNAIPTTALYQHRILDKFRRIEKFGTGELVRPWDVMPGQFLFFPDFLIGRTQPTELRNDPRYLFIESVTFSTPYDVRINGARLSTIPQLLAKARTLE